MILGDFIFVVFHLKIHQAVSCKYFETSDFIIVKKKSLLKDLFFLCSNSFYIFLLKKIKCLAVERLDVQIEQSRILIRYDNISYNSNVITISRHIQNPGYLMSVAYLKPCEISTLMEHIEGSVRKKCPYFNKEALIVSIFG